MVYELEIRARGRPFKVINNIYIYGQLMMDICLYVSVRITCRWRQPGSTGQLPGRGMRRVAWPRPATPCPRSLPCWRPTLGTWTNHMCEHQEYNTASA